MSAQPLIIETPSGRVCASVHAKGDDAVIYTLGGALRGTIHVTGTHHPRDWDQFTALRASFGSVDVMASVAPADSLPRLRNSRTGYVGSLLIWQGPTGQQWEQNPIQSTAGNAPSPKTGAILQAALHACAEDAARRPDADRILNAARLRETPGLLRFFASRARACAADIARYEQTTAAHRREARTATAAWWTAARWFTTQPHPALMLLLADHCGSLARRAAALTQGAAYYADAAAQERSRNQRFQAEADSLRAQMLTRRPAR